MQRKTIPETAGFNTNPWANFGIVKNQGFDASLEVNKSFGKDFFLSLRGNFTFSRNEIVEYDESETMKQTTRARTGNPLNTYYGLKAIGLFQEEDFKADGTLVNGIPDHTFEPVNPVIFVMKIPIMMVKWMPMIINLSVVLLFRRLYMDSDSVHVGRVLISAHSSKVLQMYPI